MQGDLYQHSYNQLSPEQDDSDQDNEVHERPQPEDPDRLSLENVDQNIRLHQSYQEQEQGATSMLAPSGSSYCIVQCILEDPVENDRNVSDRRTTENYVPTCPVCPVTAPSQTAMLITTTPAREAAVAVTADQQSKDASAGVSASSNTEAAADSQRPRGQARATGRSAERQNNVQTVTYDDLNIITETPNCPDKAVTQTRIHTFQSWPHQETHPKKQMAEAGFYYTGHVDLVRCFHCNGGLKSWECTDDPWVEHARWFPRCPFIRVCKGQRFIDAVQKLNDPKTRPKISLEDVAKEMKSFEEQEQENLKSDIVFFNNVMPSQAPPLNIPRITTLRVNANIAEASINDMIERLEEENKEIQSSTMCKMCQTREVNVLFLPCGHLVACAQCAPAITTCVLCRQPVKGSVRVCME